MRDLKFDIDPTTLTCYECKAKPNQRCVTRKNAPVMSTANGVTYDTHYLRFVAAQGAIEALEIFFNEFPITIKKELS